MAGLFEKFSNLKPSEIATHKKESLEWFRANLKRLGISKNTLRNEGTRVSTYEMGDMYLMSYDAKYGDVMPYYDRYPLVLPFEFTNNGFYGLNLHYIAPRYRVALLEGLYETVINDTFDREKKFRFNYKLIKSVSRLKYGKPCIKRYLTSHIDGTMMKVDSKYWDVVSMLPASDFGKVNTNTVYAESRKQF